MRNTRKGRDRGNFGAVVLLLLLISVAVGFLFDFVLTQIECSIYPCPEKYVQYVENYSEIYGVPEEMIWAVIKTESDFDASAVSNAGAVGLMQLAEDTFKEISNQRLKEGLEPGMRYDPETSFRYGTYYLSYLYARYGNWNTALAAYNAGLGRVDEWLSEYGNAETGILKEIPYKETRNYMKKVNKAISMYEKLY